MLLFANPVSSAIFQQVVDATRGEYVLHGTLGQSDALGSAFLAREVTTGRSVLLVVPPDAESLDVVAALSDGVPADAGGCAACGFRVATWVDTCPRCDRSLLPPSAPGPDVGVLRDQLRDSFEVVGSVPHVRGGTVYFGNELPDQRLAAFVVRPQPDGQLMLDVVWEAAVDTAPAAAPAPAAAVLAPHGDGEYAVGSDDTDAAPTYTAPTYAAPAPDQPPPARRGWLPVGIGVGALAVVGVVAFVVTRHSDAAPVHPTSDTVATVPTPRIDSTAVKVPAGSGPIGPGLTGVGQMGRVPGGVGPVGPTRPESTGTSVPVLSNDSVRIARALRRHIRDSLNALNSAILTIDGDLPTGWTQSVNGARGGSERRLSLKVGVPVTIRIDAPGYCADTISLTPTPKSNQHWAPTLRGRPTVGDC